MVWPDEDGSCWAALLYSRGDEKLDEQEDEETVVVDDSVGIRLSLTTFFRSLSWICKLNLINASDEKEN